MSTTTETTRTETRPLREWVDYDLREHERLRITRYPQHGVALVSDGQYTWAARMDDLDAALDREVTYTILIDDGEFVGLAPHGLEEVSMVAYTEFCELVQPLAPDAPGVTEACERYGIDPDVLQT